MEISNLYSIRCSLHLLWITYNICFGTDIIFCIFCGLSVAYHYGYISFSFHIYFSTFVFHFIYIYLFRITLRHSNHNLRFIFLDYLNILLHDGIPSVVCILSFHNEHIFQFCIPFTYICEWNLTINTQIYSSASFWRIYIRVYEFEMNQSI